MKKTTTVYRENINKLCREKFGESAYKIICGCADNDTEESEKAKKKYMGKSKSQLFRIYNGMLPCKKHLKEDFEKQFEMPWYEIESYIKYGERKKDLPNGFSAQYLREKFRVEREPNLNYLLPFLGISEAEWKAALNGENEMCYFMSDELEDYFDLYPGTLRGNIPENTVQTTHCFTPYNHEPKEENEFCKIKCDIDTDSNIKMVTETAEERAFQYRTDAALIKTRKDGIRSYKEPKENNSKYTETLKYVADALFSDNNSDKKDSLAAAIKNCIAEFWNSL